MKKMSKNALAATLALSVCTNVCAYAQSAVTYPAVVLDLGAAPLSEDLSIYLKVNPDIEFVFDLSAIKPDGAVFGTPAFESESFTAAGKPKIAFNELKFTLSPDASGGAVISIPVTAGKEGGYDLYFYIEPTEKEVPVLHAKSVEKEYDGKPVPSDALSQNGSYAEINGERIEGEWVFANALPTDPCEKTPMTVSFIPKNPDYETVNTVVTVTVSKIKLPGFSVTPRRDELNIGNTARLLVRGVPPEFNELMILSCPDEREDGFSITEVENVGETVREFAVTFPIREGVYTFTAEFLGNEFYETLTAECTVWVGIPKPEEAPTTEEEFMKLIENAENGGTVTAKGISALSSELVRAAAEKKLALEIKLSDDYTWIINTAKLERISKLDLGIESAVIPEELLKQAGGETGLCFNVSEKELGNSAKLELNANSGFSAAKTFANLFLYSTSGELEFVSCAKVDENGRAALDISQAGKYAVIIDTKTKMLGDCNSDCMVNPKDSVEVLTAYVNAIEPLDVRDYPTYDYNGDGRIDPKDALEILRWYVLQ